MTLNSFDVAYYALAFIVPGFVAESTLSIFVTRRSISTGDSVVRYLTLSAFNHAIWSWLIYLLMTTDYLATHHFVSAMLWVVVILIAPVLMGVALGFGSQRELPRKVLQYLGLHPVHIIPTAWDWRFRKPQPAWVLVTLKNGGTVAGYFGGQSFASSEPTERDIFVEQLYDISTNGPWTMCDVGKGMLIRGDEVSTVEFWPT